MRILIRIRIRIRIRMRMRMGDFVNCLLFEGNAGNLNRFCIWRTRGSSKEENDKRIYDECVFKIWDVGEWIADRSRDAERG
jgi:hypothetical protein